MPMKIYLGKIPMSQVPLEMVKEVGWIVGLAIVNGILWKKEVKEYVAMGD
jgi:ABC-type uncharacterized transport system permease subunit